MSTINITATWTLSEEQRTAAFTRAGHVPQAQGKFECDSTGLDPAAREALLRCYVGDDHALVQAGQLDGLHRRLREIEEADAHAREHGQTFRHRLPCLPRPLTAEVLRHFSSLRRLHVEVPGACTDGDVPSDPNLVVTAVEAEIMQAAAHQARIKAGIDALKAHVEAIAGARRAEETARAEREKRAQAERRESEKARAEAKAAAKATRDAERARWVEAQGSDRLRLAAKLGLLDESDKVYREERVACERGARLDTYGTNNEIRSPSSPVLRALEYLRSRYPADAVELVWFVDDDMNLAEPRAFPAAVGRFAPLSCDIIWELDRAGRDRLGLT